MADLEAQVLEGIYRRRFSCRGYQARPVPGEVILNILKIAQQTPSWCNSQPWRVVITQGEATENFREALFAHSEAGEAAPDIAFPLEYHGVYKARRRECGFGLYESVGIAPGDRAASARQTRENFRLFGAPHVAIITTDAALGTYGVLDCGAYVTSFMLAAQAFGVASIAQASLAAYAPFVRAHFSIPAERQVVCGISFGYEDKTHPANKFRTTRATIDETVEWRG